MSRDDLTIALVVAVGLLGAAVLYPFWSEHIVVACPTLTLAGIPCPTCGATRAFVAVVRGVWGEALAWNPLAGLVAMASLAFVPLATARVVAGQGLELSGLLRDLSPAPLKHPVLSFFAGLGGAHGRWLGVGLLAANWAFLLVWFPR